VGAWVLGVANNLQFALQIAFSGSDLEDSERPPRRLLDHLHSA
jgi:hypothetical protein